MKDRQIKVTKFGIRRSISASELEVYQNAGWGKVQERDWAAYNKKRRERAKDGSQRLTDN